MDPVAIARLLDEDGERLWANLGLWSDAEARYADAAEALARHLAEAAGLGPRQRVLDLGVGCGEQLRLWLEGFGVGEVVAFEPAPGALARAEALLGARGLAGRVELRAAPAADAAQLPAADFDRVLALDCAYHFAPREAVLTASFERLRPGGRWAATDLLVAPGAPREALARWAPRFGIPAANLWDEARYRAALTAAGFVDLRVERLGERVLAGFARHVRGRLPGLLARPWAALPALVTAGVAGAAWRRGWLDYALVTATRPAGAPPASHSETVTRTI